MFHTERLVVPEVVIIFWKTKTKIHSSKPHLLSVCRRLKCEYESWPNQFDVRMHLCYTFNGQVELFVFIHLYTILRPSGLIRTCTGVEVFAFIHTILRPSGLIRRCSPACVSVFDWFYLSRFYFIMYIIFRASGLIQTCTEVETFAVICTTLRPSLYLYHFKTESLSIPL